MSQHTPEAKVSVSTPEVTALLPCPFCGSEALSISQMTTTPDCRKVRCNSCWARTGDHTDNNAIAAWNTRTDPNAARLEKAATRLASLAQAIQSFLQDDSPSLREADALDKLADEALAFVEALALAESDTKQVPA